MTVVEIENMPGPETVMWCHQCCTFQHFRDLRRDADSYVCIKVDCLERWPFGVWDMRDQPDYAGSPCWSSHADRNDVLYPGQCDCSDQGDADPQT